MLEAPRIVQSDAQHTATIHLTIPRDQIQQVMGPAIGEVMAAVTAQGIAITGPVFSHHFKMEPATFDFEVGVPVAKPISAAGRVQPSGLPATTVARTVYRGGYEGLGNAWGEFMTWIAAQGHNAAADLWECYIAGPESGADSTLWCTEFNRPLLHGPREG